MGRDPSPTLRAFDEIEKAAPVDPAPLVGTAAGRALRQAGQDALAEAVDMLCSELERGHVDRASLLKVRDGQ